MRKQMNFVLIIFILISIIIFTNNKFPLFYNFTGIIQDIFNSPLSQIYKFKTDFNGFSSRNTEIERLKEENRKLIEKFVDYEALKKDNQALKSQYEEAPISPDNLIPAKVIGYLGKYDFPTKLIINKGEKDQIKQGAGVILSKNLVGKIDKVSKSYSQVILPTNNKFSIIGKTQNTGAIGVIKGQEDFILLEKVVISDNLQKTDIVLSHGEVSEQGVGIPADIIVGKILTVNKTENKPFQNAFITSMIDYSRLNMVFVVKGLVN